MHAAPLLPRLVLTSTALHAQLFVEDMPDIKSGYSIVFHFRENPYFQNETLVKKFTYHDDGTAEVTGEPPVWFPGQVRACTLGVAGHVPVCSTVCCLLSSLVLAAVSAVHITCTAAPP